MRKLLMGLTLAGMLCVGLVSSAYAKFWGWQTTGNNRLGGWAVCLQANLPGALCVLDCRCGRMHNHNCCMPGKVN